MTPEYLMKPSITWGAPGGHGGFLLMHKAPEVFLTEIPQTWATETSTLSLM